MSDLVKIEWLDSDEKIIPGYGVVTLGSIISVPEHIAVSFVYGGKAKKVKDEKKVKVSKPNLTEED